MGIGGGTGLPRQVDKLRPYRVDFFDRSAMLRDTVLVRSVVVRAVTAKEAEKSVGVFSGPGSVVGREIIRAYRFYKKLSPEPKVKKYIPIEKLVSAHRAIEIMTEIENQRDRITIRPEKPYMTEVPPADIPADILAAFKAPVSAPAAVDEFATPAMDTTEPARIEYACNVPGCVVCGNPGEVAPALGVNLVALGVGIKTALKYFFRR